MAKWFLTGALLFVLVLASLYFLDVVDVGQIKHDPRQAADMALQFADLALVKRDYTQAHQLFTREIKRSVTVEQLKKMIEQSHPTSFPKEVTAAEFERPTETRAMQIYLVGKNGEETFEYRLAMKGSARWGYCVGAFFRGAAENESAPREKF